MTGSKLGNRYELLERIGGGGMSLVYKARDMLLDRIVAVKVLRAAYASDDDVIRRLRREAQAAASLSHPNIVGMYDVGQEGDVHYLVMEYIAGQTLKQKIQLSGPLPVLSLLDISIQICEALEHAHSQGVIHRDIKPHNIMMTPSGKVKVADFGIARAASSSTLTHSGTIIGSVHYFSPEQARGGFAGEKSDIYSLGVVMYEMATGKVPFEADSPITIALKHVQEEAVPPRRLKPHIPESLEKIILKALSKEQSKRYQSASEMLAELRKAAGREPVSAHGPTPRATSREVDRRERPPVRESVLRTEEKAAPPEPSRFEERREARNVKRKARIPWFLVLLVVLLGVGFGVWRVASDWLHVPTVQVPDVTGRSLTEAQRMLREARLEPSVVAEKFDERVPASHIISQQPEGGELAKVGRTISLTVSMGQEFTVVPDISGLSVREATLRLSAKGLEMGAVRTRNHPTVPPDAIITQNPRADTRVAKGTLIDVEVSAGPEVLSVVVPGLIGDSLDTALEKLASLRLVHGTVIQRESGTPAGVVIDQEPVQGSEVKEGAAVNLVVSKGAGAPTNRTNLSFLVPGHGTSVMVRVTLTDMYGTRPIYQQRHSPGTNLQIQVEWSGPEARVRFFVDDALYREEVLR